MPHLVQERRGVGIFQQRDDALSVGEPGDIALLHTPCRLFQTLNDINHRVVKDHITSSVTSAVVRNSLNAVFIQQFGCILIAVDTGEHPIKLLSRHILIVLCKISLWGRFIGGFPVLSKFIQRRFHLWALIRIALIFFEQDVVIRDFHLKEAAGIAERHIVPVVFKNLDCLLNPNGIRIVL